MGHVVIIIFIFNILHEKLKLFLLLLSLFDKWLQYRVMDGSRKLG